MANITKENVHGVRRVFSLAELPDEIRLTLLLFLLSFCISGVPRVYTQTAAHALFIEAHGAAALPWAYLAEAFCVPLIGYAFIRFQKALALRTLIIGTLTSQIVALLLFRVGIAADIPLISGASIVYFEIEFVLSSLLLWGLANQLMTLRQGKRLFGFVSAGEPVAIIACGLSTPLALRWLSVSDLFLLSALGAGLGIILVNRILARHPLQIDKSDDDDSAEESGSSTPWWRDRYVVTLVTLVFIGQLAYFLVDNAFYVAAGTRYPDETSLASFLGVYSAIVGAVSLLCSVLLAPWILRKAGVRGGLLVLPGLLVSGSLLTVVVGVSGGPLDLLFLLVVGNKIIDQSLRYTLDKTTFVTLFQPLPAAQRMRTQAGLESIVEPLSGGVAGLLLFCMIHFLGFGATGITAVILCVACVWTGLIAMQYRGYLTSLRATLASTDRHKGRLAFDDEQSRALFRQGLASDRAGEVLYCLTVLSDEKSTLSDPEIVALLKHPVRDVRLEVARRIERGQVSPSAAMVHSAIASEPDASVRGALVEALAAVDVEQVPEVSAWLDDVEPDVRLGAAVGLLRHGGVEGVLAVGPRLLDDLRSLAAERRCFAATVMRYAGSTSFYRPVLALLNDEDVTVARAALHAAGEIAAPKLWPGMIAALERPDLERAAIAALARVGDPVLPLLDALLARTDPGNPVRQCVADICARIASPAADQRSIDRLYETDSAIRRRVLRHFWLRHHRCPPGHGTRIDELVLCEVAVATSVLTAWSRLPDEAAPDVSLLRSALLGEATRCIETCFELLAHCIQGVDIYGVFSAYQRGGAEQRAYAIEMLDNAVDARLKPRLFALLEPETPAERVERLDCVGHKTASVGFHDLLAAIADDASLPPLVRACAWYAGARPGSNNSTLPTQAGGPLIISETLAWINAGCPDIKERTTMLTVEKMLILRRVDLFSAVREEYLASVAGRASVVRLRAGETLFTTGDPGNALFIIVSGRLKVLIGERSVEELGDYEVVGELAALDPEPRSATVVASADSLLLRLTSSDLDLLMSDDIEVARGIIQNLCRRLRRTGAVSPAPMTEGNPYGA